MNHQRGYLVEFLIVAALVVTAMVGAAWLSLSGQDGSETAHGLRRLIDTGFGGLLALAYAAGGGVKAVKDRLAHRDPADREDGQDGA